jgi:nitrite reductase (cytochrome c-552)
MPYHRVGAMKVSDHHVRSPLLNIENACQTCHPYSTQEILARATAIQDRTQGLLHRSEEAVADLIQTLTAAMAAGVDEERLEKARAMHRKAQWRMDYVAAENSMGFHAPQESARILAGYRLSRRASSSRIFAASSYSFGRDRFG